MSLPILLALAGTALMAIAIFGPFRSAAADTSDDALPRWPELVVASATECDVPARLDLVDALASLGSTWAIDVLHHARSDETDPAVQAAIDSALEPVASRP